MRFQEKLKRNSAAQIWTEYCGFLDLDLASYMRIQHRLMDEQLRIWKASGLGKTLLDGRDPQSFDELREFLPLTSYEDYAEILLAKRVDMLPAEPVIWIQTTWEGGIRPIKLAPYTRGMLDTYKHNTLSITMLTSGYRKGEVNIRKGDRILYGGAPLPYATGLIPSLLDEDIRFAWLPDADANNLSFGQRIKKGFTMAMNGGIDYIFATGSVANYITESFGKSGGGSVRAAKVSPGIAMKWLRAKYTARRDGRPMVPGDVFKLKGFVCTGTDARCFRERLEKAWGIAPIEIAAGTESTCIATESQLEPGMVFFPDACFYEFIPEEEMKRSLLDSRYKPNTCLMDEVCLGESYELVISVLHGGAFMRYRIGDVYRCISAYADGRLPRFTFVDRVPNVIDIAGFTRITESAIDEVIRLSKLGLSQWLARKEFDQSNNPYLHMYVELDPLTQEYDITTKQILTEHLALYFRAFDSDYADLKKLLGIEPLVITVLKSGTIEGYQEETDRILPRISPSGADVSALLRYEKNARMCPREIGRYAP